jgi:hypothetical protein
MSGYSSTPLAKKLGIKPGARIKLVNAPDYYDNLFTDLPGDLIRTGNEPRDFIHFFTKDEQELLTTLPKLRDEIVQNGIIWVSWPKKSSKIATNINENTIRDFALSIGLVDIKVCAVDDIWSGLKLVIPVKDRK